MAGASFVLPHKRVAGNDRKPGVPVRNRSDRWIKDSDLRKGTWMTEQSRTRNTNNIPLDWKPSDWIDTSVMETSNGVSLADVKDGTYSLMNYDGTWAPAPADWDSRPAFRDHQSAEGIESWIELVIRLADANPFSLVKRVKGSTNFFQEILGDNYYFSCPSNSMKVMGEIVPTSWRPGLMDGRISLGEFWAGHLEAPPSPYDPDDLNNVTPWWDHSPKPMAIFQLPLEHPNHRGVDTANETKHDRMQREAETGANGAIDSWKAGRRAKKGRFQTRGNRHHDRMESVKHPTEDIVGDETQPWVSNIPEETIVDQPPDLSIHPKVNLFVRRAQTIDIAQITSIYNHYVNNTIRVPETTPVLPSHMNDRLRMINAVSHCFLVACLPSGPSNRTTAKGSSKLSKCFPATSTDRIIGFAYTDDFNDPSAMYRFLAEVEVYVDHEYLRQGVASCLMDKLSAISDPSYLERGGYEVRDDDLGKGGSRYVSCLWINLPYSPEDGDKEWVTKWLESLGFAQTGEHKRVAHKIGKSANLAVFTKHTSTEIDPQKPPIDMAL